ncbi:MAG TPA: cytochrome c peroxidase [Pseudomonadales bacterium]|nr:cytochrome c peroxidase [Pseudomonadales bacterium]
MRILPNLLLLLAATSLTFLLALCAAGSDRPDSADVHAFILKDECPPSFMRNAVNACEFVSLYQNYSSPDGFGGLRVPLPSARDGFSPQEIDLGRYLFFDPLLSGDRKTSCAHCHHPDYGYADGLAVSVGFGGEGVAGTREKGVILARAAPTLWNTGFLKRYFWDARADSLEQQATGPLFSELEMGNTEARLETDINGNAVYRSLFQGVYDLEPGEAIVSRQIIRAITAFEASLVSLNSRYDRYAHGDQNAMTPLEIRGHNVFRSFVARCSQCHTPPLFTNGEVAVIGSPEPPGKPFDAGADLVFKGTALVGGFKIPTLRNITKTAPYMHSGAFESLEDVVAFYNDERGHAAPSNQNLIIHWHITYPDLGNAEEAALIAFLKTLDDESMAPIVPVAVPSGLEVVGVTKRQY